MAWTFDQTIPIYLQAAHRIRSDIVCGRYAKHEKLPSVRDLALTASINPNTLQRAFSLLEEEGLVVTVGTSGRFVTSDDAVITRARDAIAAQLARDFSARMAELGFSPEEAAASVRTYNGQTENPNNKEVQTDASDGTADS